MSGRKSGICVDEEVKIGIQLAINRFLEDDGEIEMEFPSSFSSVERAYIHRKCNGLGLVSKSHGKGTNRYLTVRKKGSNEVLESPMIFKFGQNSRQALHTLLHKWPMKSKEKMEIQPKLDRQLLSGSLACRSDINKPSGRLPSGIPQIPMKCAGSSLDHFRTTLPVFKSKELIVSTIWNNSVVLISGDTGSGKTTQIPQYILDESLQRNEVCRIVCTQPRRISAVAMAERVATERGENVGHTVGYQIRLESRASPRTLLTFCTNGVLLRTLMSGDDVVQTMTHIIIDEVHERDRFSDFLLIKLRQLVATKKHFRLILMSAALDIELFVKYFEPCPIVTIPGNMYDVKTFFLEDVLKCTGYLNDKLEVLRKNQEKYKKQEKVFSDWCTQGGGDGPKSIRKPNSQLKPDEYHIDSEIEKLTIKSESTEDWIAQQFDDAIFRAWRNDDTAFDQIIQLIANDNAPVDYRHSETGITALMAASARGRIDDVERLLATGAEPNLMARNQLSAVDLAKRGDHWEVAELLQVQKVVSPYRQPVDDAASSDEDKELLSLYHQSFDDDNIDHDLIMCLLQMLCSAPDNGAILVFLPGYDDIVTLRDLILEGDELTMYSDIRLFTLHSSMQSSANQSQVFKPTPHGTRKIILSTNIAESAITIDDVVYVVDSGKVKLKLFDSITSTSSLKSVWISQASAIQRRGRAGRCRPGTCFHLFSSVRYSSMISYQVPELLRTPLHELCLQVKMLNTGYRNELSEGGSIENFLSQAPSPPSSTMVKNAVNLLKTIDALDSGENLTELGQHLVDLPIEPRLAKMVLNGVLLKCLDPILTIACSLAYKDPFMIPQDPRMRKQALESKVKLSAGTFSDHMCLLRAFQAWQKAKSDGWEQTFCRKNFLSQATMEMIVGMRSQLLGQLRATGFVRARGGNDIRDLNTNSENWAVVKAAICASMYPNILRFDTKFRTLCSTRLKKVRFHNSSVLAGVSGGKISQSLPTSWLVFDEMTRSSSHFNSFSSARCCTAISPACVAIFTGPAFISENEAVIDPEPTGMPPGYPAESDSETDDHDISRMSTVKITDWIKLQMEPIVAHMLCHLRIKWYSLFARRIRNSSKSWQPEDEAVLSAIINILSCEDQAIGLTQPSGIGQRPRPLSQDDGSRASRFLQRTPDSARSKTGRDQPSSMGRKQPKALNFRGQQSGQYSESGSSRSSPRSRNSTPASSPRSQSSLKDLSGKRCAAKPPKHFVLTLKSMADLKNCQRDGQVKVSEDATASLIKCGKGALLFFSVHGVGQLQACAKLLSCNEAQSTLTVDWLTSTSLSYPINQPAWTAKTRAVCTGLQSIDEKFAESLLQSRDMTSFGSSSPSAASTPAIPTYRLPQCYNR